eukprot:m.57098 g.57098  ORF g.57098 m.57098 type:complete len:247 (+) comp13052_c0_seq1:87-827(+)
MADEQQKKLDTRIEFVLKKRKKKDREAVRQAKAAVAQHFADRKNAKMKFVRVERLIKDARRVAADNTRLKALKKNPRKIVLPENQKLLLAVRIDKGRSVSPRVKKMLQLLRLDKIYRAVFLQANEHTLKMLQTVEPYVAYGYPTLKTVRDLIYKRGYTTLNKERVPLSDNAMIEAALGSKNIICVEDIVHEVMKVGPNFRTVSQYLHPFVLGAPKEKWQPKNKQNIKPEEKGNCHAHINQLVERMC